ncbi:MotA/TolQ/ExbB proton channel family protein [Dasania marina]|uniref:MotA/TolQ/ExbB proton channel family protein n=1 Tax=Dasania marina TaxID=471499 RepID=UPI00035E63AA|nr:MotA/TolQ/ExbB proton channel family protein [Dasania marina]
MFTSSSLGFMHLLTGYLLEPVVWLLLAFAGLAVLEIGVLISERFIGLKRWQRSGNIKAVERLALRRIERSDFITRIAPMLGLMGTLIPLGPGLAALGEGELSVLTTAMSVAFDTTVLGLLVGVVGFVMGRIRRRWYDELLTAMEDSAAKMSLSTYPPVSETTAAIKPVHEEPAHV